MLYIYKRSSTPIVPWAALRHGGTNNLDAGIRGEFLLLCNVDVIQREGAWHYIFEFEGRNSLETSGLARLLGDTRSYPDDMDWKGWLGDGCQLITSETREKILNLPPDEAHPGAIITGMREAPTTRAPANPPPTNLYHPEIPEDFILSGEMG